MQVDVRYVCDECLAEYIVSTPDDLEASRPSVLCTRCDEIATDEGAVHQDHSRRAPDDDGGAGDLLDDILGDDL